MIGYIEQWMIDLLAIRDWAREKNKYDLADSIRDIFGKLGIEIRDLEDMVVISGIPRRTQ